MTQKTHMIGLWPSPPMMKRVPRRHRSPGGDFLRDRGWFPAEAGEVDVLFSVTVFPFKKLSRTRRLRAPDCARPQAADARQIDPRPLAGRVAAFRRVPRFRLQPLWNKEQAA